MLAVCSCIRRAFSPAAARRVVIDMLGGIAGYGKDGALGDGVTTTVSVPVELDGVLQFTQIDGGDTHSCGLAGGAAFCWGKNSMGQIGDGTNSDNTSPTAVVGGLIFVQLSSGHDHNCALTSAGVAYCWGTCFEVKKSACIPLLSCAQNPAKLATIA